MPRGESLLKGVEVVQVVNEERMEELMGLAG